MIPRNIRHSDIKKAARFVDRHGVPGTRISTRYDLIIDGGRYPPKFIVSKAYEYTSGTAHPASEFNAVEAVNYFKSRNYAVLDKDEEKLKIDLGEDEESTFAEGKKKYRLHRHRERDGSIPKKAKLRRLAETGTLSCDVCGFDFVKTYGILGQGFIEAHHTIPVSELDGKTKTKITDLSLVCANCHRMLHAGETLISIQKLKDLIGEIKST